MIMICKKSYVNKWYVRIVKINKKHGGIDSGKFYNYVKKKQEKWPMV